MMEAVADITKFHSVIRRNHPPLPPMGRRPKHRKFVAEAKAYWRANRQVEKTGSVLDHIKENARKVFDSVPKSSRYRLVLQAREEVHSVADF
jgi:hypothetical protein